METFIRQIDNLISKESCEEFIFLLEKENLQRKTEEINFDGEQHEFMNLDKIQSLKAFDSNVRGLAQKEVDKYLQSIGTVQAEYYLENSMLLKLKTGTGLTMHYDNEISEGGLRRNFIVLLYLQDIEGGEIVFPKQSLVIKPRAGRMIIMPTFYTHPHAVLPTPVDRYTYRVNFFIKSGTNDTRNS